MARSNAVSKMREIAESTSDPKTVLFKAIGSLKGQTVLHAQVLVATYIRPAKTAGGILMPDRAIQEDQWQGTIGMVVALGPGAFKDAPGAQFHGLSVKVGDWVMYRPADGINMLIRQVPCRLFEDVHIKMIVTDPEIYW